MSGLLAAHATTTGIPPGLRAAVDLVADGPVPRDLSLCHGELGTAEALLVLDRLGYGVAEHRARRAGLVLSALERYGAYCGVPNGVSTPGLLMGLAGIGYELLRLGFADRVPSALLLEPSSTTKDAEGQ